VTIGILEYIFQPHHPIGTIIVLFQSLVDKNHTHMPWKIENIPVSLKKINVALNNATPDIVDILPAEKQLSGGNDLAIGISCSKDWTKNGNETKDIQKPKKKYNGANLRVEPIKLNGDARFPNSNLPVLLYRGALNIPFLFPAAHVKNVFKSNNWSNSWENGIFKYHHYHSTTHEVLGIYKGKTTLQLGGEKGIKIEIKKGDVLVIPAGVAHKNLGKDEDIKCVGAYPNGMEYDMNYGKPGERPQTDKNIKAVPIPSTDPVGKKEGVMKIWG